jgi:hypothetical protein
VRNGWLRLVGVVLGVADRRLLLAVVSGSRAVVVLGAGLF